MVAERYVVEDLVGAGGLAEVYRVRHVVLGSVQALKLLTWNHKNLTERFFLEGRIQAQLTHPNIVRVSDVLRHEGHVALIMEFVTGTSLEDLRHEIGALPLDDALALFAPILAAVDHAHQAGVLHRDLKPANVLLSRIPGGWVPKVADFGLAKVLDEARGSGTRSGISMGTPGYMAPEQVRDSASADRRTDVFALGCILYEMLTGQLAYEPLEDSGGHVEITATIERLPSSLAERLPDCPEHVVQAVARAMDRDRDARFPDCRSFAQALGIGGHPSLQSVPGVTAVPLALSNVSVPPEAPRGRPSGARTYPTPVQAAVVEPIPSAPPPGSAVSGRIVVALLLAAVALSVGITAWLTQPVLDSQDLRRDLRQRTTIDGPAAPSQAPSDLPEAPPVPDAAPVIDAPDEGDGAEAAPVEVGEPAPEGAPEPAPAPLAAVPADSGRPLPEQGAAATQDVAPEGPNDEAPADTGAADDLPPNDGASVATVAPPVAEPPPAPVAPKPAPVLARPPLPTGRWVGTAGGSRLTLDIVSVEGTTVRAEGRIPSGVADRVFPLDGTLDPRTGALQLSDGTFTFEGVWSGSELSGSYGRGTKRSKPWQVTPPAID